MGSFSVRNTKEILRDPINMAFGLGFPIALLLLLTAIQANVPVEVFPVERLTPGIAMFGLSFVSLFSATLIAKDRSTASDPAPLLSPHGTGFHPGLYPAAPSHVPDSERGMLCDGLLSGPAARMDSPRGLSGPHPVQHLFYLPGSPVRLASQRQAGGRHLRGIVDKYGGAPLGYMV